MSIVLEEAIVFLVAACVAADEVLVGEEVIELNEVAARIGVDGAQLMAKVKPLALEIAQLEDDELEGRLAKVLSSVPDYERLFFFEAAMRLILADNLMFSRECSLLVFIAEQLSIPMEVVLARVSYEAAVREDLAIDVEEVLDEFAADWRA